MYQAASEASPGVCVCVCEREREREREREMRVCMYVCMDACMCVCIHLCMCVCMYACMYVCMYVCTYVCMHIRMYVCIHTHTHTHMCVCVYIYMSVTSITSRKKCGTIKKTYLVVRRGHFLNEFTDVRDLHDSEFVTDTRVDVPLSRDAQLRQVVERL